MRTNLFSKCDFCYFERKSFLKIIERVSSVMVSIIDCGSIDPCSIHGLPIIFSFFLLFHDM